MKTNLGSSGLVQAYIAAIGIVLMPVYLHHLGSEAFGLVGLFLVAQAWVPILDMGFTPAVSREVSRMRAGELTRDETELRFVTLEWVFGGVGLGVAVVIWFSSDLIALQWIDGDSLAPETVALSIGLIAPAVILRWYAGLYRAVLIGLEQQQRVNFLLAGFATMRFAGVIPLLVYLSPTPEVFFTYQILVSAVELIVSRLQGRSQLIIQGHIRPLLSSLKPMVPLVGGMVFLNIMWVLLTQIDKLILSGFLSLHEYGYFTLAIVAAGGVLILIPTMNQVIQPRLSYLIASGQHETFKELYRLASQAGAIAFLCIGASLAFFSPTLMLIWTGNPETAAASAPILFWYALANALVGIMLMPFMMQFAKGDLRLHVVGHVILLFTLLPALIIAARDYGAIGAGQVFFGANALFLLAWTPLVHNRFLPELAWRWLISDILPIVLVIIGILWVSAHQMPTDMRVIPSLAWVGGSSLLAVFAALFTGSHTRSFMTQQFRLAR